jgi:hypothetical protein
VIALSATMDDDAILDDGNDLNANATFREWKAETPSTSNRISRFRCTFRSIWFIPGNFFRRLNRRTRSG